MAQLKLTANVSDLADVAKKTDLVELQGIFTSHTLELQQLQEDKRLEKAATRHSTSPSNRSVSQFKIGGRLPLWVRHLQTEKGSLAPSRF